MTFEIFGDGRGHWCARRADGLVGGTFVDRESAIRFARRECRDLARLSIVLSAVS